MVKGNVEADGEELLLDDGLLSKVWHFLGEVSGKIRKGDFCFLPAVAYLLEELEECIVHKKIFIILLFAAGQQLLKKSKELCYF